MDQSPKQQIIESLKAAESIVVTTSQNPTVDQAAAVIALTEMLRDVEKKAVAAFDPNSNSRTGFLNPNNYADPELNTVRDFVLELDESKAKVEQFRYDREGDRLKIYITPKKGSFSSDDVSSQQGDFNVDRIVALGVTKPSELFSTVAEHNELTSTAKMLSLSVGTQKGSLPGASVWHEDEASSLTELLVGVGESLGAELNTKSSTALLTGIMSETENFTNNKTSPKVMTMAAQLMAAGANQQQIVKNLKVEEVQNQPQPQDFQSSTNNNQKETDATVSSEQENQTPQTRNETTQKTQQASRETSQTNQLDQQTQAEPQSQSKSADATQQQHQTNTQQGSQPNPHANQQQPQANTVQQSQPTSPVNQPQSKPVPKQETPGQQPPRGHQEFSVDNKGQLVAHETEEKTARPKPPEPQEVLKQEQSRSQPNGEQSKDVSQGKANPLNNARGAVEQALGGQQTQAQPEDQSREHPKIKPERHYQQSPPQSNEQSNASEQPQEQKNQNPFNSTTNTENGSNGAIL